MNGTRDKSESVSGYESASGSEIESRSRGGHEICRALNVSVCSARLRGLLVSVGRVGLGYFVAVKGRVGKGRIGRDR